LFYFFISFFSPNTHLCLLPPFPNAGIAAISTSIPERWCMAVVVQEGGVSRPERRLPAQPWPRHRLRVLAQTLAMAVIKLPLF
jgi:hypothetical protein